MQAQILTLWPHSCEPQANHQACNLASSAKWEKRSLTCRTAHCVYMLCSRGVALLLLGGWETKQNEKELERLHCFSSIPFPCPTHCVTWRRPYPDQPSVTCSLVPRGNKGFYSESQIHHSLHRDMGSQGGVPAPLLSPKGTLNPEDQRVER